MSPLTGREELGAFMAYKAAVFDLDGTLLNTIVDLAWATNYALEQFNMPTYTVDEVRQMVGNGVAKLIRDAVPKGTDDETYQLELIRDVMIGYFDWGLLVFFLIISIIALLFSGSALKRVDYTNEEH